ncbi:MAG: hypothetical protein K0R55_452 [Sporomusa sp.]|nr:hypothetical protein [Sporomusa sp.]
MKSVVKKVIIFSMVGLMQVGFLASAAEAAVPQRHGEPPRYEQRNDHHQREMEKQKEHKIREENARHEKEMKRRPFESNRKWHDRQQKENERHERAIHEILHIGRR